MENKIELPMRYPPITSSPPHADLLSVIMTEADSYDWIMMNYIQLRMALNVPCFAPCGDFERYHETATSIWNDCPWVSKQVISREVISRKWNSFIEFVIENIFTKNYVYVNIDRYYIEAYDDYGKRHFRHEIFIYGYDIESEMLYVADFFENGKYSYSTVSFTQLEEAYSGIHQSINDEIGDFLSGVHLIKLRNKTFPFHGAYDRNVWFCADVMISRIKDYLSSKNESLDDNVWGASLYGEIKNRLILLCNGTAMEKVHLDVRAFHVLYDHKVMMVMRVNYLFDNQIISDKRFMKEGEKIRDTANMIRNMYLKFEIKSDNKILFKIIDLLGGLQEDEESLFGEIINVITAN